MMRLRHRPRAAAAQVGGKGKRAPACSPALHSRWIRGTETSAEAHAVPGWWLAGRRGCPKRPLPASSSAQGALPVGWPRCLPIGSL